MKKKHLKDPAQSVVYEVNLAISASRKKELLKWLKAHMQDMLNVPGFMRASLLQNHEEETQKADTQQPTFSCTVRYHVDSLENLNTYFATLADTMRAQGVTKFGDALHASRKIYTLDHEQRATDLTKTESNAAYDKVNDIYCMNCEALLRGPHCHRCGQKYQRRVVPIFDMVSELVSGVFEWDSRFWRTAIPLLFQPGRLTKTYLAGQRQRYIPPIRLYLITSVVFFLAATIQPKSMLMHLDVEKPMFSDSLELSFEELDEELNGASANDEAIDDLSQNVDASTDIDDKPIDIADATLGVEDSPTVTETDGDANTQENQQTSKKRASEFCEELLTETNDDISNEFIRDQVYQACKTLTTRRGLRDFSLEMLEKLPLTLMALLPFMALVHKILYLFAGRYYVEHLLFYVHNFSFLFVFSTIVLGIVALLRWQSIDTGWVTGLSTLYVIYYFLRSMRVVYNQGRIFTFVKWLLANFAFVNLASVVLALTAALTATQLAQ